MKPPITRRIWDYYQEQLFHPGLGSLFLNPLHLARRGLWRHMKELAPGIEGRTLDVGCGTKPYRRYCRSTEYIGLEIDSPGSRAAGHADAFYDGRTFPFPDGHFDSALANQVLEHVFNPGEFLGEIHRVVKPGGTVLITVPFVWDEHEQPYDYARYSSFGLKHLLESHGFSIIEQRKAGSSGSVLFQLGILALYRKGICRHPKLNILLTPLLAGPLNLLAVCLIPLVPRNKDLYLDNIFLVRRKP